MTRPLDFQSGDLVWARVKGYPWWPAVISACRVKRPASGYNKWKVRDPKDGEYKIWCAFYNEGSGAWTKPKSIRHYSPDTEDEMKVKETHKLYPGVMAALNRLKTDWKMFESMGLVVDNKIQRTTAEDESETEDEQVETPPPVKRKRGRPPSTGARGSAKKRKTPKGKKTSGTGRRKSSTLGRPRRTDVNEDLGVDEEESDIEDMQISAEDEEELYAVTQGKEVGKRGKSAASASAAKLKDLKEALRMKTEELDKKSVELRKKSEDVERWKKKYNGTRRDLRDLKNGASAIVIPPVPAELESGSPVSRKALFKKSVSESMLASMVGDMELNVKKFAQQGKEADQLRQELMNSVRTLKQLVDRVRESEQAAVDLEKQLGLSLKNLLEYNVSVEMLHATRAGRAVRDVRKKLKHSRYITSYGDQLVNEWMNLVKNAQSMAEKTKKESNRKPILEKKQDSVKTEDVKDETARKDMKMVDGNKSKSKAADQENAKLEENEDEDVVARRANEENEDVIVEAGEGDDQGGKEGEQEPGDEEGKEDRERKAEPQLAMEKTSVEQDTLNRGLKKKGDQEHGKEAGSSTDVKEDQTESEMALGSEANDKRKKAADLNGGNLKSGAEEIGGTQEANGAAPSKSGKPAQSEKKT